MVIFNVFTVAELFLVLIPAALVGFGARFLGFDGEFIGTALGIALLFPLDLLLRLAMGGGGDGDEEAAKGPNALLRLILPGSGGHLFFVPTWICAIPLAPLVCLGVLT